MVCCLWFVVFGCCRNSEFAIITQNAARKEPQTINYKLPFDNTSFTVLQIPNGLLFFNSSGSKLSGQF